MEFVFKVLGLLAVRFHLGVVIAQIFHDLVNDELGVAPHLEALDSELDGYVQAIYQRLIFSHVVGGHGVKPNHISHMHSEG